ncbi:DUF255 domain-containing protein [Streptomyces koelreuteriae]|uniref:DUF255 domain-containing protein n=1 Tax=Streptomyces koelreuteriae TaxID=2838015 RepID=UPI003EC02ED7
MFSSQIPGHRLEVRADRVLLLGHGLARWAGRSLSCDDSGMNRLANEQSPHLLHPASNPVDWWPWGEEAMEVPSFGDIMGLAESDAGCSWPASIPVPDYFVLRGLVNRWKSRM